MSFSKRIARKNVRDSEFVYRVINVSRVSNTRSGGRRMSISVLVVIGNQNGVIGIGLGNDVEMKLAESKALKIAQNNLFSIPLKRQMTSSGERVTVCHFVNGSWCSTNVDIFSAKGATSVIGGPVIRAMCECIGITDLVSKVHGSSNPHNVSKAFLSALMKIKTKSYYSKLMLNLSSDV
ncbi:uS5 family small ribosomal subunit protein [Candidatus Deianiraea vastatrix]|uniref:Small ribosomal subunit protein uS5 n=1 Tax=Candidatus Deianiraea vastatrix TaxID=2163644 RepID=A0A5B8XE99_9RICK|nr:30S ribosomal protein S5 [Candidatus Deianiraea vastatrix]QED23205.1 30S ribosomal protein S5 [Candidatus Deianiraea vastatrix]